MPQRLCVARSFSGGPLVSESGWRGRFALSRATPRVLIPIICGSGTTITGLT